jgi:hypothetical protein
MPVTVVLKTSTSSTLIGLSTTASLRVEGTACGSGSAFWAWLRGRGEYAARTTSRMPAPSSTPPTTSLG